MGYPAQSRPHCDRDRCSQRRDIALAVTSPAPADIWEAEEAVLFVQSRNAQATARLVFNKVRKATVLGRLVDESAKQVSVPSLPVMLSDRECYKHAIAQGWKALDHAAREEVLQLSGTFKKCHIYDRIIGKRSPVRSLPC